MEGDILADSPHHRHAGMGVHVHKTGHGSLSGAVDSLNISILHGDFSRRSHIGYTVTFNKDIRLRTVQLYIFKQNSSHKR